MAQFLNALRRTATARRRSRAPPARARMVRAAAGSGSASRTVLFRQPRIVGSGLFGVPKGANDRPAGWHTAEPWYESSHTRHASDRGRPGYPHPTGWKPALPKGDTWDRGKQIPSMGQDRPHLARPFEVGDNHDDV